MLGLWRSLWVGVLGLALGGGAVGAQAQAEKTLNLYNWADYIGPDTIPSFEKATGIKVNYDVFDSAELLQSKLLLGRTAYDVVVPSAAYVRNQIAAGIFQKLDKRRLPNLKQLDPALMAKLATIDPGNNYVVPWAWGTNGLGINVQKVREILGPEAPLDSLALLFDPQYVSKLKACGVSVLDSPGDMVSLAQAYLGRRTDQMTAEDLKVAFELLRRVRPYITQINTTSYNNDLAQGDICLAAGYSGELTQAVRASRAAGKPFEVRYVLPREGSVVWIDVMAVPTSAPHTDAAYRWINHVLDPQVSAGIVNQIMFPTAVPAASAHVRPEIRDNKALYLDAAAIDRLGLATLGTFEINRQLNRMWLSFKSRH
ncbi:extracellular solute-binding protein [Roseateles saccharophilus]|uniref:Putrescine-binding periplasmic protein n=1 Tax=Roseateles saccharophilus TaxID=304 RepID=A0A4R3VL12_ROSSA|nr:putative spermidine/putrescine transport system substrate-binding protein/putrescine transport system substrate-binding protein [Roseateles saccharophilus]